MSKKQFLKYFSALAILSITVFYGNNVNTDTISASAAGRMLIPCGFTVGISLHTDGLMVTGTDAVRSSDGQLCDVARDAGIRKGDRIASADGTATNTVEELINVITNADEDVTLQIYRDGELTDVTLYPAMTENGRKIGVWVRDSAAGLGTVTFIDPETKSFAALGHGISDTDTGDILPVREGNIQTCVQTGIKKGERGEPGELNGYFGEKKLGTVTKNCVSGLRGAVTDDTLIAGAQLPAAAPEEVQIGSASVLADVDGNGVQSYAVQIKRIQPYSAEGKNMIIKITDSGLIEKTGGIVQGMSGAPILQNGKIVGAVTHVFVNNPEKGYGIFIDKMLD